MRAEDEDFNAVKLINAPVGNVFNKLSTLEGLAMNWQKPVNEEVDEGRDVILERENGAKSTIKINIQIPHLIQWTILSDTAGNGEWEHTIVRFELLDMGDETSTLHFMHIGLTPELENYQTYANTWQQFLDNVAHQSEYAHVN